MHLKTACRWICHREAMCSDKPLNELTGETLELRSANTSSEARLDISARGVWAKGQRAFFDVRVIDPLARKYNGQTLTFEFPVSSCGKQIILDDRPAG